MTATDPLRAKNGTKLDALICSVCYTAMSREEASECLRGRVFDTLLLDKIRRCDTEELVEQARRHAAR